MYFFKDKLSVEMYGLFSKIVIWGLDISFNCCVFGYFYFDEVEW